MFRKIFFALFILLFALLIYAVYYYVKLIGTPASITFNAVPLNAIVVMEFRDVKNAWKSINESNSLWKQLTRTGYFREAGENGAYLDSLIAIHSSLDDLLQYRPALMSLHRTGSKEIGFLFVFAVPPSISNPEIHEAVMECSVLVRAKRQYDDAEIIEINLPGNKTGNTKGEELFTYSVYKNLFIGAFSPLLVEDAIRQLNSGISLAGQPAFESLMKTADKKSDANVFINFGQVQTFFSLFIKPAYQESVQSFHSFASWCETDLAITADGITAGGFTVADDSSGQLLTVFSGKQTPPMNVARIMPDNTSFYTGYTVWDAEQMLYRYRQYLGQTGKSHDYENRVRKIKSTGEPGFHCPFIPGIGGEIAFFITKPDSTGFLENCYAAVQFSSAEIFSESIREMMSDSIPSGMEMVYEYKEYEIRYFPDRSFLSLLPFFPFPESTGVWYAFLDEYAVFGFSRTSVQKAVDAYLNGKTLANNSDYNFFIGKLASNATLSLFCNTGLAVELAAHFANRDAAGSLKTIMASDSENVTGMAALQFFPGDDMVFTNINAEFFKSKVVSAKEPALKRLYMADTSFSGTPFLVINHNSKMKEIFLQDDGGTVYLWDNSGALLWKKKLNEKISGDVIQVDALCNNKLQYLFSTRSTIHLIDRKGNYVVGFPVKLTSPACAPLSVFDYDRNRQYRIFIPCRDKKIYSFDISGKPVEGWQAGVSAAPVFLPLQYFSMKGKDYIVYVDSAGNIYATGRKGEVRAEFRDRLSVSPMNSFYIDAADDLNKTALVSTDSAGTVHFIRFGNRHDTISFDVFSSGHFFVYEDINNDLEKEFIFLDKDLLQVFGKNREERITYNFNRFANHPPVIFELPGIGKTLGIVIDRTSEIFLFSPDGKLLPGFPLQGNTSFAVGDLLSNNTYHLIAGTSEGIADYELAGLVAKTAK
ncbi:MAG: hypothetical protein HYY40_07070 [Bacteroidetes bacterium]|nr:hypothetical protein [Bacteroidota bacterium]